MRMIVFSQLYCSKSATLEIAYDMKIDSLLCNLYFPLKQQSAKTICTYILIKSHRTLNESVWTEINWSQWYEQNWCGIETVRTINLKTVSWSVYVRTLHKVVFIREKNCLMNCLRTFITQSRLRPGNKKPMKYDVVRIII